MELFLSISMISSILLIIFLFVPAHFFLYYFDIKSLKPYDLLIAPLFLCVFFIAKKNNFKFYFNKNLVIFPLLYMIWGIIFSSHDFSSNSFFFNPTFFSIILIWSPSGILHIVKKLASLLAIFGMDTKFW